MFKGLVIITILWLLVGFGIGFEAGFRAAKLELIGECLGDKHFRVNELKFECALTVDAAGG